MRLLNHARLRIRTRRLNTSGSNATWFTHGADYPVREMASRLIDWTLAHLWLMWAFVGLTFLVMLFIPDARWNAITTAWGALLLGLLISLVLEQRGEGIQRRVWLTEPRNADRARRAVDELLPVAAHSAAFAVDLPSDIMQALMSGATHSARREAAERARAHMYAWTQVAQVSQGTDPTPADELVRYAQQAREVRQRHGVVLSRVSQLDTALDRFLDALRWYEEAVAKDSPGAEYVRAAPRYYLLPIGEAAVRLCEGCADLLFEARLLPP